MERAEKSLQSHRFRLIGELRSPRYPLVLIWLLICAPLCAPGCGPSVSWPNGPSVPPGALAENQLLDCSGAEAELCGLDNQADAEPFCRKALRSRSTAFHGHRCLAYLHLQSADTLVVIHGGGTNEDQLGVFAGELTRERSEELNQALEHVEEALVLGPGSSPLHWVRLEILFRLQRFTELTAALKDALPYLDEGGKTAVRRYAERRIAKNDLGAARTILATLAAAKNPDPEALALLGTLEFAAGDVDASSKRLRRALEEGVESADVGYALVEVEAIRGNLDEVRSAAVLVVQSIGASAVTHEPTWIALATDLDWPLPARMPEAYSHQVEALRGDPDGAGWGVAATRLAYERPMSGLILAMAAEQRLPLPLGPAVARADVLRALGYPSRAADAYQKYLSLVEDMESEVMALEGVVDPDQARLYGVEVLLDAGRTSKARSTFDRVTATENPEYLFIGARVLAEEGKKKKAIEWFRQVLRSTKSGPLADAARREIEALKAQ